MDQQPAVDSFQTGEASQQYVGQWNRLVSTTNWEKGRIILQWRQALIEAGADSHDYSDEAWSRQVGGVSSQHVGRLRRVFERFGAVHHDYTGLYWSHFQSALDWDDAEMWLEGAVQNGWSISQMRHQRWEVLGAPADQKPRDEDVISSELDEDFTSDDAAAGSEAHTGQPQMVRDVAGGPDLNQGPDFGDDESTSAPMDDGLPPSPDASPTDDTTEAVRPFENLPELPEDLQEACEAFKLAILHHKLAGWADTSLGNVLATLDALKQLAQAPSAE